MEIRGCLEEQKDIKLILNKLHTKKTNHKIVKAELVDIIYNQIYYNYLSLLKKYITAQVI